MNLSTRRLRVLIADDEPLIRAGIQGILDADPTLHVIGHAADGSEALQLVTTTAVDVLLLDIQMPNLGGLDVLARIRESEQGPACLILTTFGEDSYIAEAIRLNADGFALKSGDPHQLLSAVHAVASGGAYFSPTIARRLVDSTIFGTHREHVDSLESYLRLTPREQEVLKQLSNGATNAEIAAALHLAPGTIKTHVSSILRTTGARNRVEAALIALRARRT